MQNERINQIADGVVDDDNNIRSNKLIKVCSYIEKIENNRIFLTNKKLKLVQILDTKEDYKHYLEIMETYVSFIRNHYFPEASSSKCDMRKCFLEEISTENGKLPLFFVYNNRYDLLGICGIRSIEKIEVNKQIKTLQELSVRIFSKNNETNGYGALSYITTQLYVLNNNVDFFAKTYFQKRDFWFHMFDKFNVHYIKTIMSPFAFLNEEAKMDLFSNIKNFKFIKH